MRGLYGQSEGNEFRQASQNCDVPIVASDQLAERIADNLVVEGEHVATLRRMFRERDWKNMTIKCQTLRNGGFSQSRIDAMLNQAGHKVIL